MQTKLESLFRLLGWEKFRIARTTVLTLLVMNLTACVSPRVWVQSRSTNSGVIGYQNYDPSSDGGARINALIPCKNHDMVWNGYKSQATGAATYYNSGNFLFPVDSGVVQWVEYHYACKDDKNRDSVNAIEFDEKCVASCNAIASRMPKDSTVADCIRLTCEKK